MKIVVVGAGGLVGQAIVEMLGRAHHSLHAYTHDQLDIMDTVIVRARLRKIAPDLVINAAAYTDVDGAEDNRTKAHALNATAPTELAAQCARAGAAMVHLSTDCVFGHAPGTGPDGRHRETDPVGPLSVYGRSKLLGEIGVARQLKEHLIIRTSWVVGPNGRGFIGAVTRRALYGGQIPIANGHRGCPTPLEPLAQAISELGQALVHKRLAPGLMHFCGNAPVSRMALAHRIVRRVAAISGRPMAQLTPTSPALLDRAVRPAVAALACDRFIAHTGTRPPDWELAVDRAVTRLCAELSP